MKSALGILVPALLLALLERSSRLRFRPLAFLRPYFATDVVYLATGYVAGASLALAYVAAGSAALGWLGVPRLAALGLPLWRSVPLALVALDAGNYLAHWLLHRVDALWEFHKVHHSSRTLDWLATFRSHLVEQALRRLVAPVLLVVAGFPLNAVVIAAGLFTAWATFNHSNLRARLGPLEWLLVTPGFHRAHHVPCTTERNLGTVFTVWDALRGTLVRAAPTADAELGVPLEVWTYPQDWLGQLVEPFAAIRSRAQGRCRPGQVSRMRHSAHDPVVGQFDVG
jgi:sterol desaturase/sphingolipid hydroxylase (fatty acid hydroxylase superfamily)